LGPYGTDREGKADQGSKEKKNEALLRHVIRETLLREKIRAT